MEWIVQDGDWKSVAKDDELGQPGPVQLFYRGEPFDVEKFNQFMEAIEPESTQLQ
jgi:hypothetical protein